VEKPVHIPV
jgi:hypothetical protein